MTNAQNIKIGVGAVVFRGDDVLLIRRGKPPFEGQWSIPGGGLEFGESIIDAVHREVREETGLTISIVGLLDVFEGLPGDGFPNHVVMVDYVAEWVSGVPVAGDDAIAAEFVAPETARRRLSWDKTREAIARAVAFRSQNTRNGFKETP